MKFACKDCESRYIGCHEHCKNYLRDKMKATEVAKQRRMEGLQGYVASCNWAYQHKNK